MATVTVNWTGGMEGSTYIDVDGQDTKVGGDTGYFYFNGIADGSHSANGQCGNSIAHQTFEVTNGEDVSVNLYL